MAEPARDPAPRLFTLEQAAAHMSVPVATMRKLGIGRVCLGTKVRYDRLALEAWVNAQSGIDQPLPAADEDDPEAALARFARRFSGAPARA